jgi:hypothetical protein
MLTLLKMQGERGAPGRERLFKGDPKVVLFKIIYDPSG